MITLGELLLYAVCLPIILVSWRNFYFCKTMPTSESNFGFTSHVLRVMAELAKDLPYVLPLLFVVLSWRAVAAVKAIRESTKPSETREAIAQYAGNINVSTIAV